MRIFPLIVALALLLAPILGCDKSGPAPPPPGTIPHAGTIGGRVIFSGKAPQLPRVAVTGDPHCVQRHPDGLPDEAVVIAGDGAMANVFVYLKDAPRWDGGGREPAVFDQVDCQFVPHVVGVQINQPLRLKNSDPVFHNVHVLGTANQATNHSSMAKSEQTIKFESPEFIVARCDIHPWMKGIIGVFETPYFAVTGSDGKFSIGNVPPGSYTLAAWHERFGELTKKITVAPDGTVKEDFAYAP